MEQELKYALPDNMTADSIWTDPAIVGLSDASTSESIVMKAVYFDTPQLTLSKNNMAVRVRSEGGRRVATLKWGGCSANGFHERHEINVPVTEDLNFIRPNAQLFQGSEDGDVLLRLIGDADLQNLLETRFLRRQIRLNYKGSIIEMALDSGSIITDAGELPIMELELELYAGNVNDMMKLGQQISDKYSLSPEDRSKFARGLAMLGPI